MGFYTKLCNINLKVTITEYNIEQEWGNINKNKSKAM
jgi:hypothetical protein